MAVRRIEVLEGGHAVPLVVEAPLLSSSHIAWEGILLEEHSTPTQHTQLRQPPTIFLARIPTALPELTVGSDSAPNFL